MKYYIAVYNANPEYIRDERTNERVLRETRWWQRDRKAYKSFEDAMVAREHIMDECEDAFWSGTARVFTNGNKLQVWSKRAWDRLDEGFKHPDERDKNKLYPKPTRTKAVVLKEFNQVETALGAALRAAGV